MKTIVTKNRHALSLTRLLLFIGLLAYATNASATIRYVKATAAGAADGSNWDNASNDLQAMITASAIGDEVWVAKGTYKRTNSGESFRMAQGVRIFGGFAGNEESLAERDLTISDNASILRGNGSYVVGISGSIITNAAVLDGFTITDGTNGGIYNIGGSPTIRNCIINNNTSTDHGAGIYNSGGPVGAYPVVINCSIKNNTSTSNGGGIYVTSGITIINCSFTGNKAAYGGGIYNPVSSSVLTNCSFTSNTAHNGGGMYNSGGAPVLSNCLFANNTATYGGAMNNYFSSPKLRNCIIYGNNTGIANYANSSPDIQYSLVQGINTTENHNISGDTDPLFVDAANGDYRLQLCSPVINTGSNSVYDSGQTPDLTAITTDLIGNPRFFQNGTVDMGAYEYNQQPPTTSTIHVDASVATPGNGDTWTTAVRSLAEAIQIAHQSCISIDKILVAEGTYYPEYKAGDGTTNRHKAFTITRKGLEILGGYPTGGSGPRDPNAHPTILSGDLGVVNDNSDNAYHVLLTVGGTIDATLKLDGFTIRDGNANGSSGERITVNDIDEIYSVRAGGWYNVYGNPVLNNIKIISNRATTFGAGVLNHGGSPTVINATISNNSAQNGGGWYNNVGNPILKNVVIRRNSATSRGGGWFNSEGFPEVRNLLMTENTATLGGAAWYNSSGTSSLLNCTISGNSGGGTSIQQSLNSNTMNIRNSIVWGPNDTDFSDYSSDISYANTILRGSGGSTNWNNLAGQNSNGNLDKDPLFVDPANGNYQLQLCSPAINAGNTALISDQSIPDLNGNTRIVDTKVDMGAYEYQAATVPFAGVLYVKEGGVGTGNSWECATGDLQAAINAAQDGEEVWVAKGDYKRANSGGFFTMAKDVKIYGGFAGDETSLAERDLTITANASTLRGNGGPVVYNNDNGLTSTAVLDGFTITGGSFEAVYNNKSSPTFSNCLITGNTTPVFGGGVTNKSSWPVLINCVISNNTASFGAGMYNTSASPTLINCTISGNTASTGGGGGMYNVDSYPKLLNSIVYGNNSGISDNASSTSGSYCLVQGITNTDNHNISGDTDPLFVDPANGNYRLQLCSPVINKGSNTYYATGQNPDLSTITTDLDGEARFYGNGTVDMGAYEFHQFSTTPVAGVTYVKAGETGTGTSWDCATGDLQAAINAAKSGEEVWVAGGDYQPIGSDNSFSMREGVKIYGGFEGDETNLTERNLTSTINASTLKGTTEYVVNNYNNELTATAVLDGFTITGGPRGGVNNTGVSPTFRNCIITGNTNTSTAIGGGMYNIVASPILINCVISGNSVDGNGGGMYNLIASPILINCTISGNTAFAGGGIFNNINSSPKLLNTIVYGNNNGIYDESNSSSDIKYSLVQDLTSTDANGNISGDTDPLFVDPANGDYRLQPCSPIINKGSDSFYESGQTPDLSAITTDLLGEPRFYGTVDMGAYEYAGSPSVPTLAGNSAEFTQTIFGNTVIGVGGSACTIIASLLPNRGAPLSGDVTAKVWVESTQPKNFVKRHYQITAAGAESATAKVTLYFTQQEFDEFNLENTVKLPVDAEDIDNYKANLRIEKRPGTSSDNFGLPGSYSGTPLTINPLDPAVNGSITWNAFANRWEVSFDVTGFSGFFVKTTEAALPLNLISFTATKENGVNLLNWKTTNEINTLNFEVQSSANAKNFTKITTVPANGSGNPTYNYQDATPYFGNVYYRLKMNDRDGSFAYSKIISLMNDAVGKATIHPNPATESITLTIAPTLLQSTAILYDVTGRQLQRIPLTTNKQQIDVKSLSSGVYILKFADGTAERFVKE